MKGSIQAHTRIDKSVQQPVAPVAVPWPPSWLGKGAQAPRTSRGVADAVMGARGWRLTSGIVICACCHPEPEGAVAVELAERRGDLAWVEPAPAEQPPAPDPTPAPEPAHSDADPAAVVAIPDDGLPRWMPTSDENQEKL